MGLLALAGLMLGVGPAPAYADDCTHVQPNTVAQRPATEPSRALGLLQIEEAHRLLEERGIEPGQGQVVAVVDSGIGPPPEVVESFSPGQAPVYYQGTVVASVIAGPALPGSDRATPEADPPPVGIAPATKLVDVRVYDSPEPSEDQVGVEVAKVAAGLEWVAQNAGEVDVVNVSLALPERDAALTEAVRKVVDAGVIVVASAGKLPTEVDPDRDLFFEGDGLRPGVDAVDHVWPAGYEEVVSVGTYDPGEPTRVLPNSGIDIAVPTAGGLSYDLNGDPCELIEGSAHIAAAEVSGILALLGSAFPMESDEQLLSRLYRTATGAYVPSARGRPGSPQSGDPTHDRRTGAGVAQPLEALLRPLRPRKDGRVESVEVVEEGSDARAPRPEPDVLADAREDAVWFGLLAGGSLAVALILRPVLSRRRG